MKKYTLFCVLAVLCAVPSFAQGGRYDSWVVDSLNRLVANPTIRVCPYTGPYNAATAYVTGNTVTFAGGYYTAAANSTNSPPSTNPTLWTAGSCPTTGVLLYADKDLTFSQPNPFLGDSHGNYGFFAATGTYIVQANGFAYYVTISGTGSSLANIGAVPISGLAANGTTDNATAINAALALGQHWLLPATNQGTGTGLINFSTTLNSPVSGNILQGTSWGKNARFPTVLNFTGGTSATALSVDCHLSSPNFCTGVRLENFNLLAPASSTGIGIALTGTSVGNSGTWAQLRNLYIQDFAQAITTFGWADVILDDVWVRGTTLTASNQYLIDFGGVSNSNLASNVTGSCTVSGSQTPTGAGFFRIHQGVGSGPFNIKAVNNCANVSWIGDFANGGAVANATIELGDLEVITGPAGVVDQSSTGTYIWHGNQGQNYYLGAPFQAKTGAHLTLIGPPNITEAAPGPSSVSVVASGGTYTATQQCFSIEAINPSVNLGSATVAYNSGPSPAVCTTPSSGTSNSIVVNFPVVPVGNAASYVIYRGTTSTTSSMVAIATVALPATSYTSTGSETTGSAPPVGNIPLALAAGATSDIRVAGACGVPGAAQNYGNMIQISTGEYVNACTGTAVVSTLPSASAFTRGQLLQVLSTSGVSGADGLYVGTTTYSGSTPTYSWSQLLSANAPTINSPTLTNPTITGVCTGCSSVAIPLLGSGLVESLQANAGSTFTSNGNATTNCGTASSVGASSTSPVMVNSVSAASSGSCAGWSTSAAYSAPATGQPTQKFGIKFPAAGDFSSSRITLGLAAFNGSCTTVALVTNAISPGTNGCHLAVIGYSTVVGDDAYLANGHYACVTANGTAKTVTDIGVGPSNSFVFMSIAYGASGVTCTVNGTSVTNTTTLPTNTLFDVFTNVTQAAAAVNIRLDGVLGYSTARTW